MFPPIEYSHLYQKSYARAKDRGILKKQVLGDHNRSTARGISASSASPQNGPSG